jgi:class 3 adenylate cyclase
MERRLVAILAADVVGYSRLMTVNEADTLEQLRQHRDELIDPKVAQHHGRVVNIVGDGLLLEFASVVDAVTFAVDVQVAMRKRNLDVPLDRRMEFRIGVNVGDVIVKGDDVHGDGVNVAARLESLADAGGVCISRSARD